MVLEYRSFVEVMGPGTQPCGTKVRPICSGFGTRLLKSGSSWGKKAEVRQVI
jgi:hypothetical protein